jgi:hypothetical protein
MKSIDPASHSNAQSNIVSFDSEQVTSTFHTSTPSNLVCKQDSFWTRFWDDLFNFLIPRLEPKVVQKTGSDGTKYYQVYDPMTGSFQTFSSELETRIWLERRF